LTNIVAIREEIAKLDRLEKHYEKPTFEVVSSVFRALSKKKIVSAGSFQRQALFASPYKPSETNILYDAAEMGIRASKQT
jgi:hypothetical protein